MIIGEVDLEALAPVISKLETELNRQINYQIFSKTEWDKRARRLDPFWATVTEAPRINLIGKEHAM